MHSSLSKNTAVATFLTKKIVEHDLVIASCLFLLGLVTRIPFATRMIYHSDSARFALAMEHYDVAQMRPHAPGYILYVALAKLADFFVHDARMSLVAVSIIASALTSFFLYLLATKMFGRSNGIISGLLMLSSPVFWFNGEMPFTYTLDGLFSVIFAFICYKIIIGENKWLHVSAIILGLATGVRQNIFIIFLPLWLYSIRKYSFRSILISLVVFSVTCLTWLTPMVALTGGLKKYFITLNAQFKSTVLSPIPYLSQVLIRWKIFSRFMVYSLTLGIFPICYYFGRFFRIPSIAQDTRLKILLLWFVPGVLFFVGINIYNPGHVLPVLPPLFICLAESIKGFSKDLEDGIKTIIAENFIFLKKIFSYKAFLFLLVIVIYIINSYIFLFKDTEVSYASIQKGDIQLAELIKLTKANFTPEKSIVLALSSSTQATYYLPNYLVYCPFPLIFPPNEVPLGSQNVYISFRRETTPKIYWIPTGFKIEPISIPPGVDNIIIWEKKIAEYYQSFNRPLKEIHSDKNDIKLFYIKTQPKDKIYYAYHSFSIKQ